MTRTRLVGVLLLFVAMSSGCTRSQRAGDACPTAIDASEEERAAAFGPPPAGQKLVSAAGFSSEGKELVVAFAVSTEILDVRVSEYSDCVLIAGLVAQGGGRIGTRLIIREVQLASALNARQVLTVKGEVGRDEH